eukprot:TRINITY_DN29030_c0_g1_i1.p1 TRINITY_DN29030_c0_g1~~TRINITY_DN29030_c0_g1_i1.p1  ORF type:complete len:119 (+),score=37.99 TRINITY_DN29030_c0_g1_i1:26-358(+)
MGSLVGGGCGCCFAHFKYLFPSLVAESWFEYCTMSVVIETTQGDITVDLFLKERPKTCLNFLKLCKLKAYNMNLFHTIQADFIAQTGDPTGTVEEGSQSLVRCTDLRQGS